MTRHGGFLVSVAMAAFWNRARSLPTSLRTEAENSRQTTMIRPIESRAAVAGSRLPL
jgi:hypothetical protein